MTDYYDVLEVPRDATQADIRRAYREKVKECHPDVSDHPRAAERFQAITRAEEVLGDESERERYDRLGHDGYHRVVDDGVPEGSVADEGAGAATGRPGDRGPGAGSARSSRERASGGERSGQGRSAARDRSGRGSGTSSGHSAGDGATGGGASTHRSGGGAGPSASAGSGADGFGFDDGWQGATGPSAGSDNPSQRSYSPWSSDDEGDPDPEAEAGTEDWWDDRFDGEDLFGAERRRRSATAGAGEGAAKRRRTRQRSSAASSDGIWSSDVETVVQREAGPGVVQQTIDSRESAMFAIALAVIYPVFVYFTVTPALPWTLNLVVAGATVTVAAFMLTEPGISLLVYGTWSFLSPLLLLFLGVPLLSMAALFVMGAFWVPLSMALLMAVAVPT